MSLISNTLRRGNVDLGEVMDGALRGLTEGLDADSAYLSAADADRIESGRPLPAGGIGVEVRRRYYLQVVAPRDGSPAARAGVLPGDFHTRDSIANRPGSCRASRASACFAASRGRR